MLSICIGASRKRLELNCSRFYTHGELFKMAREQGRNSPIYFEYGPNLYQPINSDTELRFVCHVLEGDIDSFQSEHDREQNRRDLSDAQHTHSYEASIRARKSLATSKYQKSNSTSKCNAESLNNNTQKKDILETPQFQSIGFLTGVRESVVSDNEVN